MLQTAWATSSSGAVAALLLTTKGGALCRPTVVGSGQQPGRERPRCARAKLSRRALGVTHAPVSQSEYRGRISRRFRSGRRGGVDLGPTRWTRRGFALPSETGIRDVSGVGCRDAGGQLPTGRACAFTLHGSATRSGCRHPARGVVFMRRTRRFLSRFGSRSARRASHSSSGRRRSQRSRPMALERRAYLNSEASQFSMSFRQDSYYQLSKASLRARGPEERPA
jgi:hypothetical protein